MKKGLLLALPLLFSTAAFAQDRFAPDNPWFQDFEANCRSGDTLKTECEGSVLGAYAEASGAKNVACDYKAFWANRDQEKDDKTFAVLPWQYGVEALVKEPGVCHVL